MSDKTIRFFLCALILVLIAGCSTSQKRRSLGETLDDAVISNKLKARFLGDKVINGFDINIDTWKGVVNLKGRVDTQNQINRAIEISELQPGVIEVRSYLTLRESKEEDRPAAAIKKPATAAEAKPAKPVKAPKSKNKKASIEEKNIGGVADPEPPSQGPAKRNLKPLEETTKPSGKTGHDAVLNEKTPRVTDD